MRKSNYDKMPATVVDGTLWKGWESIRKRLAEIHAETNGSQVWVVECYQGVHHEELMRELQALAPDRFINTRDLFKSAEDIEAMTYPYLTDDRLFGRRAHFSYTDFLDEEKVNACRAVPDLPSFITHRHQRNSLSLGVRVYQSGRPSLSHPCLKSFLLNRRAELLSRTPTPFLSLSSVPSSTGPDSKGNRSQRTPRHRYSRLGTAAARERKRQTRTPRPRGS